MFLHLLLLFSPLSAVTSGVPWHSCHQLQLLTDPWAAAQPRAGPRQSPTMCSTSRAVYLLIASLTIAHNNQLRHCQRNTHSWHQTRGELGRWAGILLSSHSQRVRVWGQRKSQGRSCSSTEEKGFKAQTHKSTVVLSLTPKSWLRPLKITNINKINTADVSVICIYLSELLSLPHHHSGKSGTMKYFQMLNSSRYKPVETAGVLTALHRRHTGWTEREFSGNTEERGSNAHLSSGLCCSTLQQPWGHPASLQPCEETTCRGKEKGAAPLSPQPREQGRDCPRASCAAPESKGAAQEEPVASTAPDPVDSQTPKPPSPSQASNPKSSRVWVVFREQDRAS